MRTQQLNLIILSRWEKDKAYKACWELSLNSTTMINEACVVGGIVFARVRVLVAKPPFLEETTDLGFVSPAHSPHGLTASLLKLSRVRLDRENYIGKETIMCSRQCYSCLLSNISNMRCSVSSPDETPRRELKIRRAAEYF